MGAWIEILDYINYEPTELSSHPTMGAWIEILLFSAIHAACQQVAPHDGCVDWNYTVRYNTWLIGESHPTMGAWIEIFINRFV